MEGRQEAARRALGLPRGPRVARVPTLEGSGWLGAVCVGPGAPQALVPRRALRRVRPVGAPQVGQVGPGRRAREGAAAASGPLHAHEAAAQVGDRGRRVPRGGARHWRLHIHAVHAGALWAHGVHGVARKRLRKNVRDGRRGAERASALVGRAQLRRGRVHGAQARPLLHLWAAARPRARSEELQRAQVSNAGGGAAHRVADGAERGRLQLLRRRRVDAHLPQAPKATRSSQTPATRRHFAPHEEQEVEERRRRRRRRRFLVRRARGEERVAAVPNALPRTDDRGSAGPPPSGGRGSRHLMPQ